MNIAVAGLTRERAYEGSKGSATYTGIAANSYLTPFFIKVLYGMRALLDATSSTAPWREFLSWHNLYLRQDS